MKASYLPLLLAVAIPALAEPLLPLDGFKDSTLPLPSLSLPNSVAALPAKPDFSPRNRSKKSNLGRRFSEVSRVDRMPILTPNSNVDYKLIVKAEDPTIDPKMLFPADPVDPAALK